jgi:hypothetical protein
MLDHLRVSKWPSPLVARIDALDPELLERLAPKASLASGEAADGCEAWHQTSADFHAFDPTAFD